MYGVSYTSGNDIPEDALKSFLSENLTEYKIPSYYIRLPRIPGTLNGKLDRKAIPEPAIRNSAGYIKPEGAQEEAASECMKRP